MTDKEPKRIVLKSGISDEWDKTINEEMNRPSRDPVYTISLKGMKQFEDALKEVYPNIKYYGDGPESSEEMQEPEVHTEQELG